MLTPRDTNHLILQDIGIITLSVLVAVLLVKTGVLKQALTSTMELGVMGSFIAGMFFTSVFTTAPAIVALGEIARANPLALVALFGALGAVLGDLVIFHFVRDRLSEHLVEVLQHKSAGARVKALLKLRYFRWLTVLVGGIFIASPLPLDELGIGLMGFTKLKRSWFVPLSFVFNFVGIGLI